MYTRGAVIQAARERLVGFEAIYLQLALFSALVCSLLWGQHDAPVADLWNGTLLAAKGGFE